MRFYGVIYRTKRLTILGVMVGIITARYSFIKGGVKGYILLTNMSTMERVVLSEVSVPDGKVIDVKKILDPMFNSLSVV